jgi:hypothetical protein
VDSLYQIEVIEIELSCTTSSSSTIASTIGDAATHTYALLPTQPQVASLALPES